MRIRVVVLSALLVCSALLICWAELTRVPPSHAQGLLMPKGDRDKSGWSQPLAGPSARSLPNSDAASEQFLRLDRDGDGLLSANEMPEGLRDERHKWDANGDGFIDLAEWNAYLDAVRPPAHRQIPEPGLQPRLPSAPTPKSSGRPPFNENPRPKKSADPAGKYPKNIPAWFKEYDTDGDGQVGLYEWQAKKDVLEEFKKYDLNGDGFITVEELVRSGQFTVGTNAPPRVAGLQAEVGDYFYFEVTGSNRGVVWGTDVYTADSLLAAAAVHAGVLRAGETALVKVTILAGEAQYEGTERNGITTQNFGTFPRSFRVESVK
jgi:hypothetical protein